MPFIGAQPATTFAKATSQVFTNANGNIVDFTLNKHVSNPEDIEVFVSNVQQQPTTSYTILSDGVTLRFSEAPPSGDFYVVYRNFAQQTGTDTGAFRKTGGSISNAVAVTGNDSSYTQASGNATSTLSVINSSYTNSGNGVLYVKQGSGTNQPTMTIEQTGGGGNPNDTQGLHIKIAGQNQGSGRAIRVTTTNSSLNSGNAFDAFTVYNGGDVLVHGNIAIGTSGKGIDFSAQTGGLAVASGDGTENPTTENEVLKHYEHGTFKPKIVSSGATFDYQGSGGQYGSGHYTRIGDIVFIDINMDSDGAISGTLTNGVQIQNLPFTGHTGTSMNIQYFYRRVSDSSHPHVMAQQYSNYISFLQSPDSGQWRDLKANQLNFSDHRMKISGCYHIGTV